MPLTAITRLRKKKLPPRPAENTISADRIAMRKDKAYAKKKGKETKTKNMRPNKVLNLGLLVKGMLTLT